MHRNDIRNQWLQLKPDRLLDSPIVDLGGLKIIHTPGHTAGSVCVYDPSTGTLFSGDSIGGTATGEVRDFMTNDPHNEDAEMRLRSIAQLTQYPFERVLPFHYEPILEDARARLCQYLDSDQDQGLGLRLGPGQRSANMAKNPYSLVGCRR